MSALKLRRSTREYSDGPFPGRSFPICSGLRSATSASAPERGSQDVSPEDRRLWSVDTGFIGQNVSMFCASEGLATVFCGAVDYKKLDRTMKLAEGQFVSFAQTVGYLR